jgi:hypothetical protein
MVSQILAPRAWVRKENVHIPFDGGCAYNPSFEAFLYDFALRVVVMSPSVSQNLDTTIQRGQSGESMQSGRHPYGKQKTYREGIYAIRKQAVGADIVSVMAMGVRAEESWYIDS